MNAKDTRGGPRLRIANRKERFFALLALTLVFGLSHMNQPYEANAQERPKNVVAGQARVPEELLGQWKWGTISSLSYEDAQTGKNLGPGRGMMVFFTFEKTGRYKMFFTVQTRSYDWTTQVWTTEEGMVSFDDSTFTLQPTTGKYKSSDNRVKKNNYERPMTKEELKKGRRDYSWKWEKNDNDGKTYLMMGPSETSRSPFQRMK
jgi:hypothetical protein